MRHRDLIENVRPQMRNLFKTHWKNVFSDPSSELPQNNRMKIESVHRSSYFRTLKNYFLEAEGGEEGEGEQAVKRAKGIPWRVRENMTESHFRAGKERGDLEEPLATSWAMGSTRGLQMVLFVRSTALASRVNYKRYVMVRKAGQVALT